MQYDIDQISHQYTSYIAILHHHMLSLVANKLYVEVLLHQEHMQ